MLAFHFHKESINTLLKIFLIKMNDVPFCTVVAPVPKSQPFNVM